jgi:hypothetical protein
MYFLLVMNALYDIVHNKFDTPLGNNLIRWIILKHVKGRGKYSISYARWKECD